MSATRSVAAALACAALVALAGCKAKNEDVITIGGIFPLSGPVAVYGVECKNGIELAIEEINAQGGINGKKLALISEDDEGNPEKTVNAYKKLTTSDKVNIIIGSLTSGCTQAITSLAQTQKVLLVAPAATWSPSPTVFGGLAAANDFHCELEEGELVGMPYIRQSLGQGQP